MDNRDSAPTDDNRNSADPNDPPPPNEPAQDPQPANRPLPKKLASIPNERFVNGLDKVPYKRTRAPNKKKKAMAKSAQDKRRHRGQSDHQPSASADDSESITLHHVPSYQPAVEEDYLPMGGEERYPTAGTDAVHRVHSSNPTASFSAVQIPTDPNGYSTHDTFSAPSNIGAHFSGSMAQAGQFYDGVEMNHTYHTYNDPGVEGVAGPSMLTNPPYYQIAFSRYHTPQFHHSHDVNESSYNENIWRTGTVYEDQCWNMEQSEEDPEAGPSSQQASGQPRRR